MMPFRRLLRILRVVGKYRLDEFLPLAQLSAGQRMLLAIAPWKLFAGNADIARQSRGTRLRLALEELGPVFVKFGQLLSTRPDLVPADIVRELDQLQDNVPPFDSAVFVAIVEAALGDSVDHIFADFSRTPLASASVAQVHTAQLKNGRDVVVKAIRPGIRPVIEQDVALMLTLANFVERHVPNGHRLRSVEVVNDYRHTILDELNLQSEAANASQLRRNFIDSDMLYVPEVFWDYCRQDVMVMERIYGIPVTDITALQAQNTNMKVLAERGVEIFFTQVFEHNFFHADMHPGNIFVSREHPDRPLYIAIDCAIVGSLSRADQYYLGRNLLAIFRRDYRQVAELHVECGWIPENTPINEFESAIRSVCEPIFEKPLGEISYARILITLFQTAQRFEMEIQPSLVLLQKTLLNIEGLGRQLYPQLDLWQTALPFLEKWLRNRFHPRALLQELQRHGPEWLEKFPQVPELLFDAARQIKNFDRVMPDIKDAAHEVASQRREDKRAQQQRWLGVAALLIAVVIAVPPDIELLRQIPQVAWLCGLLGLYWLVKS